MQELLTDKFIHNNLDLRIFNIKSYSICHLAKTLTCIDCKFLKSCAVIKISFLSLKRLYAF